MFTMLQAGKVKGHVITDVLLMASTVDGAFMGFIVNGKMTYYKELSKLIKEIPKIALKGIDFSNKSDLIASWGLSELVDVIIKIEENLQIDALSVKLRREGKIEYVYANSEFEEKFKLGEDMLQ